MAVAIRVARARALFYHGPRPHCCRSRPRGPVLPRAWLRLASDHGGYSSTAHHRLMSGNGTSIHIISTGPGVLLAATRYSYMLLCFWPERTKESAEGWVVSRQPLHHHGTKIRRDEVKQPSRHIWRDVSVEFHVEYVLFHVLILASGHAWLRSASKWSGSYLVTHD